MTAQSYEPGYDDAMHPELGDDDEIDNNNNNHDNDNNDGNCDEDFGGLVEGECEDGDEFQHQHQNRNLRWSDVNDTMARPTAQPAACVSMTLPLLPNCLALVFKPHCSIHQHLGLLTQLTSVTGCKAVNTSRFAPTIKDEQSRIRMMNPHHLQQQQQQQQPHRCQALVPPVVDLGYRLFRSFRDTNKKYLFWHKDLSRCLRRLEFVGYIQPYTVLVTTTGEDWLDVLKRCWSQQLLVSPPSFSLEVLAEVQGFSMQTVGQSAAVNLIDAICGVICDLAFTSLPSTLDVIFTAVTDKYSSCGAEIPPIHVFNDMLTFLVGKRRVVLNPNGSYRMASRDSYSHRHRRHRLPHHQYNNSQPRQQQQQTVFASDHHAGSIPQQVSPAHGSRFVSTTDDNEMTSRFIPDNGYGGANNKPHLSIFRKLFKRRFFGRAKSRESTPPPTAAASGYGQRMQQTVFSPDGNFGHGAVEDPHAHYAPHHNHRNLAATTMGSANNTERPPGLFDCVNTGAVPSVSCSTNTISEHVLRRWPVATNVNRGEQVLPMMAQHRFSSSKDSVTASNFSVNATTTRLTAPFSTPTSAYLSSAHIEDSQHMQDAAAVAGEVGASGGTGGNTSIEAEYTQNDSSSIGVGGSLHSLAGREQSFLGYGDEGYQGLMMMGCVDTQAGDGDGDDEDDNGNGRQEDADAMLLMMMQSLSSSSSSWSSSGEVNNSANGGGAIENRTKQTSSSAVHSAVNSPNIRAGQKSTAVEPPLTDKTIHETCAKLVSAELDSLIERFRVSAKGDDSKKPIFNRASSKRRTFHGSTAASTTKEDSNNENNNNHSNNNLNECGSHASTGTLFSVADFMIHSASLTVDDSGEVIVPALIDPNDEQMNKMKASTISSVDDREVATVGAKDAIAADGASSDPQEVDPTQGNPTLANPEADIDDEMLKTDAGQAYFGAK